MLRNIKNYAMALGALAIAVGSLTFMSFRAEKSIDYNVVESFEDPLYWYEVDLVDNEIGNQVGSSQMTKSQAIISPFNPGCNDQGSETCLAGYSTPQTTGDNYVAPSSAEHRINKSL